MNRVVTTDDISAAYGCSKRSSERWAKEANWPYTEEKRKGGKKRLYRLNDLPEDVQTKVILHLAATGQIEAPKEPPSEPQKPTKTRQANYDRDELWAWFDKRPQSIKDEGIRRAGICLQVRILIAQGKSKKAAITQVAKENDVAFKTLHRWWYGGTRIIGASKVPTEDYAAALAPRYQGGQKRAKFSKEAWEWIYADYMRLEKPSAAAVYRRAKKEGAKRGWDIPDLSTVKRRLDKIDWKVRMLAREGEKALREALPHVTRSRAHLHALEAVNADGHTFDVRVKLPSGDIGRPVMCAWQDLYSGKILGYRVTETLNWHTVRLSLGDLVEKYGIPQITFLDNGREFANTFMSGQLKHRYRFKIREDEPEGIFKALSIEARWCEPEHGQSKPIERAFRDLCCEHIAKHPACAGAYVGNSPTNKPANYGERAMEWEDFLKVVAEAVDEHNARTGRRTETANGRSFDETFEESYAKVTIRKASGSQRRLLLLAAEGVKIGRGGYIQLQGNTYWNDDLASLKGSKVVARFDPDDLTRPPHIYSLTGDHLGEVRTKNVNFIDSASKTEHNRQTRRKIKAAKLEHKAQLNIEMIEEQQRIPDVVVDMKKPEAGNIAPLFGKLPKVANGYEEGGLRKAEQYMNAVIQLPPRTEDDDF